MACLFYKSVMAKPVSQGACLHNYGKNGKIPSIWCKLCIIYLFSMYVCVSKKVVNSSAAGSKARLVLRGNENFGNRERIYNYG